MEEPTAPRWAPRVGWAIAAAIVVIVVVAIVKANPL